MNNKIFFLVLNSCNCNLRCIFCSRGDSTSMAKTNSYLNIFDYEKEYIDIQKKFIQTSRTKSELHIGGNETLNHPNIIKIVDLAVECKFKIIKIKTDGLKLADIKFLRAISKSKIVAFDLPIYGINKKTHDKITCVKGSYVKLMNAIANLKQENIKFNVHTLILKQNIEEINSLNKKFSSRLGINYPHPIPGALELYRMIAVPYSKIPYDFQTKPFCFNKIKYRNNYKFIKSLLENYKNARYTPLFKIINDPEADRMSKPKKMQTMQVF